MVDVLSSDHWRLCRRIPDHEGGNERGGYRRDVEPAVVPGGRFGVVGGQLRAYPFGKPSRFNPHPFRYRQPRVEP